MLPGMNLLPLSLPSPVIPPGGLGFTLHHLVPGDKCFSEQHPYVWHLDKDVLVYPWCWAGLGRPILRIPFLPDCQHNLGSNPRLSFTADWYQWNQHSLLVIKQNRSSLYLLDCLVSPRSISFQFRSLPAAVFPCFPPGWFPLTRRELLTMPVSLLLLLSFVCCTSCVYSSFMPWESCQDSALVLNSTKIHYLFCTLHGNRLYYLHYGIKE